MSYIVTDDLLFAYIGKMAVQQTGLQEALMEAIKRAEEAEAIVKRLQPALVTKAASKDN